MILQKKTLRMRRVQSDLMHALPELRILIRHKHGADTAVLRSPGSSSVIGLVDAARGDCHVHALRIGWVEHDAVQRETSVARYPPWTVRMVEQAAHQRPCFPRIAAFKQRGRLNSTMHNVRFLGPSRRNLPDILRGDAGIGGKSNRRLPGIGPALSEVVTGAQQRSPVTLRRRPYPMPSAARVIRHRVNIVSVKIRTAYVPTATLRIGAKNECPFCRSY